MPIINKVSASAFDRPAKPAGRQPSPEQLALSSPRSRPSRANATYARCCLPARRSRPRCGSRSTGRPRTGVEIAVKRSPHGFYIGLLTPDAGAVADEGRTAT